MCSTAWYHMDIRPPCTSVCVVEKECCQHSGPNAQVCVGCAKVLCVILHGIIWIFLHPAHTREWWRKSAVRMCVCIGIPYTHMRTALFLHHAHVCVGCENIYMIPCSIGHFMYIRGDGCVGCSTLYVVENECCAHVCLGRQTFSVRSRGCVCRVSDTLRTNSGMCA